MVLPEVRELIATTGLVKLLLKESVATRTNSPIYLLVVLVIRLYSLRPL